MADVRADTKAVDELAHDIRRAKEILLGRLAERGVQLLREEVPKKTTNLQQGVAPPDVDYDKLQATLTVSARSARRGARTATLHLADGKTKQVKLRATNPYNYADVVAKGNKDAVLQPKRAKAFLIPVSSAPDKGSYIVDGDQIYIVRPTKKGMKANPYDERAAKRLEGEAVSIGNAVLREIFN